jgi:signal transduction histidine kinase
MTRPATSLQRILSTVTIITGLLALVATGALITVTSLLDRVTRTMADSVESIRLAEESEVDLLLHARTSDALIRHDLEGRLRSKLDAARAHVTDPSEALMLARARVNVEAYIAASSTAPGDWDRLAVLQSSAYGELDALARLNVEQARAAHAESSRWDALAKLLGFVTGGLLVAVSAGLLYWLKRHAFRHVLALANVMRRFSRGDRDVRAREVGPAELREMSVCFNELASAIAAQRQAQTAFLGGIAHDLRDPLSAVTMAIELLQIDPGSAQIRRTADIVKRQTLRLERMVCDLLEMAKVDAGELELDLDTEDLRRLVDAVVELRAGSSSRPRLELRLADAPVLVRCDAQRIEQVISNLVSNALKYSPGATPVEIEVANEAGEAVMRVIDHGLGIDEADQQHLFEPFRRVGRSRDAAPGVGLGLWVVRRIVDAHGGRIAVDNTTGGGATFVVHLPARMVVSLDAAVPDPAPAVAPAVA